jgi:hypothetical protein
MNFRAPIMAKPLLDECEYSPSSDLEGDIAAMMWKTQMRTSRSSP